MAERIQLSRAKGWRIPENTVSVARPGPWGNPFVVGRDGTAAECVDLYRSLLAGYICLSAAAPMAWQKASLAHAAKHIETLRGKNLACWCRKDKRCHADVLLEIANAEPS